MEIILNNDIDELGFEGDIINVARGYARNYLIPKGLAVKASSQNMKIFEHRKKKIEVKRLKAKEDALQLKQELEGLSLSFSHKAGEEGKLYGSITSMDIAAAMEKKGMIIDRRKILLDRPIKMLGDYEISVRIYPEVIGTVKVAVTPDKEKTE